MQAVNLPSCHGCGQPLHEAESRCHDVIREQPQSQLLNGFSNRREGQSMIECEADLFVGVPLMIKTCGSSSNTAVFSQTFQRLER